MKIQIVKKGTDKIQMTRICPWLVDEPPVSKN